MATQIFVNLPIKDLNRSVEFFTKLGYTFNPKFTDEKATCMIISDTIYIMLLTEPFFQTFTKKEIVDAHKAVECSICLSADSKEGVDEMVVLKEKRALDHRGRKTERIKVRAEGGEDG
uniref:VOC family protein n=1 Tax=Pedobacter panaciterrae TaxID=363849 RepID=UPI003F693650